MGRIFISHSKENNAQAAALRDWLVAEGWDDLFIDFDPQRGIVPGERWERALNEAASRCEAVVFLLSETWLGSQWCMRELNLAHRLNKRLFGVLIEDIPIAELPSELTGTWQCVNLVSGRDHKQFRVALPVTGAEQHVTFSAEGLARIKLGLQKAGLDASYFVWPPEHDPKRPPYRGMRPFEADDAGIFFGRAAPITQAIDRLRGLREAAPPRLMVILGASGAGKSSFLRAGLIPRLARDDRSFMPLPVIRPERSALYGETGLLRALEGAFEAAGLTTTRAELRKVIGGGAGVLRNTLEALVDKTTAEPEPGEAKVVRPTIVLSIDQAEELFLTEGADEARALLGLVRDLLVEDKPSVIALFTIRSDSYERLQLATELEGVRQEPLSLPPMPRGSYADVIKGPARRLEGTGRALAVDERLVAALLEDIEAGAAKDTLPLLAFTLERLYIEYGAGGRLDVAQYEALGRVKGSVEAAIERAFRAADNDPNVPKDRLARLALLRRGLIPWLAGIDADTGAARRRVARQSEIPAEARPLIDHLVEQRLLSTDVAKDTRETTIEPAHEALLRQWGLLQGWLAEDSGLLSVLDGVKRASRDWAANAKGSAWLTHATERLKAAGHLAGRPDLAANLESTDWDYLAACTEAERNAQEKNLATARNKQRMQAAVGLLLVGTIAGLIGWINQELLKEQFDWYMLARPYMQAQVRPFVLSADAERALRPGQAFRECAKDCPEMIVVPAGSFMMGSPATEKGRNDDEGPQRLIRIARPFAVGKYAVTFAEWDACVRVGACPNAADSAFGRGMRPVINVSWNDAKRYAAWLSRMTGKNYRLLSEAEFEYAARAGTVTAYPWGDEIGQGNANCSACGSKWDNQETAPVGSFRANGFGVYDMHGNVWQWLEDCYGSLDQIPADGSPRAETGCNRHVVRGASWYIRPVDLRSAHRNSSSADDRNRNLGFRVARTLGSS